MPARFHPHLRVILNGIGLACVVSATTACTLRARHIAAEYPTQCPPGSVASVIDNESYYSLACKRGEVLEGPQIEVVHSALNLATTTRIRLHNHHEGRPFGRMMERDKQTSDFPNSTFDMISEWDVGAHGRHVGTEIHKSFLNGHWRETRRVEWGPDGRLLSMSGTWRTLNFPNGTGPLQLSIGQFNDELRGACFEGLRDGVWTVTRKGEIIIQHSWKKGVADGEFIVNRGRTRGTMRNGHRVGPWLESNPGGTCLLATGHIDPAAGLEDGCAVAVAPVKFVAVYDEAGNFVEHRDIVWDVGPAEKGPRREAGEKLPSEYHIGLDLNRTTCDNLVDSSASIHLTMD